MERGRLYSRRRLDELGIPHQESADPDVIDATPRWVRDYVRFYFRPRTPTQFHMEGIRPVDQRSRGANCPVPVFFLFESTDILTRLDTRFSDGNLATFNPRIGDSCEELMDLPLEEIFHTGYYDTDLHPRRTYHRNAEVIVPREVNIDQVCGIHCRSAAEKQTLLNSMSGDLRDRWGPRISFDPSLSLYHNRWSYVEEAYVLLGHISLRFNPDSRTPGPFILTTEVAPEGGTVSWSEERPDFRADDQLIIAIDHLREMSAITGPMDVMFRLDGEIAYRAVVR